MKYCKKPVVIEATRNTGEWRSIAAWLEEIGDQWEREVARWPSTISPNADGSLTIETLEGVMRAEVGDWIIQGVAGELYSCKPDIFEATYEREEK